MPKNEKQTTPISEMREKRTKGIEITLPEYGDVVSIRPMDAGFFFKTGKIPDFLTATVQNLINQVTRSVSRPEELSPEKTVEWLQWLDELVKWTFISPKVVDDPQAADEIGVDEISLADKLYIYLLFGQPAQVLKGFRQFSPNLVVSVDAQKDNGTPAVADATDTPVVEPLARTA